MFRHYLLVTFRNLRRAPFAASVNIFALALGLTAFVIAYGVVRYWDGSERHFSNADRTYVVTAAFQRDGRRVPPLPITNRLYADHLRADFPEFDAVARTQIMNQETRITAGDLNTRMFVAGADSEFLEIFDLSFVAGDAKTALSQPNSAVLTQQAAAQLFGEKEALGQTITLANVLDVAVTGVVASVPEPSHLGRTRSASLPFDVLASWDTLDTVARSSRTAERTPAAAARNQPPPNLPAPPPENWLGGYCCTTYVLLARDSGLTRASLNERLGEFANSRIPLAQQQVTVGAVPVNELMTMQLNAQLLPGAPFSITTLLLALGALVLVVACVNYANLATAQAARRTREVGLHKVLGAGRRRVMLQYLTESAVLVGFAALFALIAVRLVTPILRSTVDIDLGLALFDGVGFWLSLIVLLTVITMLSGTYPAVVLSRVQPGEALRVGLSRIGPRFAGALFVGIQFASASFLLIVVLVMYAQNNELERTGLGNQTEQLVVISNAPQFSGVDNGLLRAELGRLPYVRGTTEVGALPWSSALNLMRIARTPESDMQAVTTSFNSVGYDFFETLGFTLLEGRGFSREHGNDEVRGFTFAQLAEGGPINVVIDTSLARQLGFESPQAAVDQVVYLPSNVEATSNSKSVELRVIGVVADKPLQLRGAGATSNAYWLRPGQMFQVARIAADDIAGAVGAIDATWQRLSGRPTANRDFVDQLFNENYENFARINQVFGGLAIVAAVIALIGLFGMAVHVASRRVREIGVRKSIGARTTEVVVMLVRDFSKPVLIANLLAWPLAYVAVQQYLSVFMHRISLTPLPFALSLLFVLAIAGVAVGGQALRAARVNPAVALRGD